MYIITQIRWISFIKVSIEAFTYFQLLFYQFTASTHLFGQKDEDRDKEREENGKRMKVKCLIWYSFPSGLFSDREELKRKRAWEGEPFLLAYPSISPFLPQHKLAINDSKSSISLLQNASKF